MAEQDTTKGSRRARRRAEQASAEIGDNQSSAELSPDTTSEPGSEPPEDPDGDPTAEGEEPELKPNRRQRRAEAAGAELDVRDRNLRLRDAARTRRTTARSSKDRDYAVARGLDASEMVDDALARTTHTLTRWFKRNFNLIQWAVLVGIVGGIGWQVYSWRAAKQREKASDQLMKAVAAEAARVGEPPSGADAEFDVRQTFPTEAARTKAALDAYQQAMSSQAGDATATLARLGIAGLQYDQGKYAEAVAAYSEVRDSKLAKQDSDVRLRAVEGIGLALEAKGDLAGAKKAFRELGNSDVFGFAALGLFHQARLALAEGKKEDAKILLGKVKEKTSKADAKEKLVYVDAASQELMEIIDPSAAAAPSTFSPEQLDALRQSNPAQLGDMLKNMGLDLKVDPTGGDAPPSPQQPAPAPEPSNP